MARKIKESDIIRFIELTTQRATINSEIDELKEKFGDAIEYAIPDEKKENVVHITIGKSTVTITTVIKPYFDSKRFAKEHPNLKKQYTSERAEERYTAKSER